MAKIRARTSSTSKTIARSATTDRYGKSSHKPLSSAIFISEKKNSNNNPGHKHARY